MKKMLLMSLCYCFSLRFCDISQSDAPIKLKLKIIMSHLLIDFANFAMWPGTKLVKRLKRVNLGINRLDKIAKQHDIDYSHANNFRHSGKHGKHVKLPGRKTMTERIVTKNHASEVKVKMAVINSTFGVHVIQ